MPILSKTELKKQVKKYIADPERVLSIALFAELCGMSLLHFRDVFITDRSPVSENVQMRANKALEAVKNGEVRVMQRRNLSRYVEYRKVAQPNIQPSMGLKVTSEGIKLRVGMVNRHDYSQPDLDEALRG